MSTFVVRFLGDPAEDVRGRVRHVSSGEEISFTSFAELLAFFEGMSVMSGPAAVAKKADRPAEE